jgi:hypothetical protein
MFLFLVFFLFYLGNIRVLTQYVCVINIRCVNFRMKLVICLKLSLAFQHTKIIKP